MGGFSSLPPLNTIEDFERLTDTGTLPPGRPSQDLLDSLPEPPPPKPMTWIDDGTGEPVPPSWMKAPGRDWYRVVFDDGTEMSAAEYRAWRAENGVAAPPTAVARDGRPLSKTSPAPAATPTPTADDPTPDSGQARDTPAPAPAPKPPPAAPASPPAGTAEETRRRRLQARAAAEAARRSTVATSWRGVLTPPATPGRRRKTLLGE